MNMNEKKYNNLSLYFNFDVQNTWDFNSPLKNIIQGTTAETRIGDKIFVHSIYFNVTVQPKAGGSGVLTPVNGTICRFVIWHNKQTNGTATSYVDLFDTNTWNSLRAVPYMHKCSLLVDRTMSHTVTALGTNSASGPIYNYQFAIHPKKRIEYTGSSVSDAVILKDNYGLGVCADDTDCCQIIVKSKVIFSDA